MNDNDIKKGDMVQHRATGIFGVVISDQNQNKQVDVRTSDSLVPTYFTFELVTVSDEKENNRLDKFDLHEDCVRGTISKS